MPNDKTPFGDKITYGISSLGIVFSMSNVNEFINFILLVISLINIIIVCILRVRTLIKTKKYDELDDAFKETKKELENLRNETDRHYK